MENNIITLFGLTIKKIRKEKNISQEKLAEMTGLHRTYISEIERGTRNLSLLNINKLSIALNLTNSELFSILEQEGENLSGS